MTKRIYIADDDENILFIIYSFLINEGYIVERFSSGDALYERFKQIPADLVILDIIMEGRDGLILCSQLRQDYSVLIILVSALDSEMDRIKGISLGSDDYLVKPFSPLELVARIKSLFRRVDSLTQHKETSILKYGNIVLNTKTRQCFVNDDKLELTPTEFNALSYMLLNPNQAVSRQELLKHVWGSQWDQDTRVTDDMVKRLRKKIVHSNVRIESVWGFGFRLSLVNNHENN
jgi:DNA-binding response OmpR family regulator